MLMLLAVLLTAQPDARQLLPVQADLAVQGALTPESRAGAAVYVGGVLGLARPPWGSPFAGGGLEVVYSLSGDPYQLSYGLQFRAGYAWSSADQATDTGPREVLPDALVYLRVTPFLAGDVSAQQRALTHRTILPGVRVGLGLTAPWWSRLMMFSRPFATERGFAGETLKVLSALVFGPVALINHAELLLEVSPAQGPPVSALIRVGSGF